MHADHLLLGFKVPIDQLGNERGLLLIPGRSIDEIFIRLHLERCLSPVVTIPASSSASFLSERPSFHLLLELELLFRGNASLYSSPGASICAVGKRVTETYPC